VTTSARTDQRDTARKLNDGSPFSESTRPYQTTTVEELMIPRPVEYGLVAFALIALAGLTSSPSRADTVATAVESGITVQSVAAIRAVLAADDRTHLVYELLLIKAY
jgi:hypothetical protein